MCMQAHLAGWGGQSCGFLCDHKSLVCLFSPERFVIASYNVLADQNVQEHWKELYWHIPPFIMDWDARKRKLLWELGLWSPDILCLQVRFSSDLLQIVMAFEVSLLLRRHLFQRVFRGLVKIKFVADLGSVMKRRVKSFGGL